MRPGLLQEYYGLGNGVLKHFQLLRTVLKLILIMYYKPGQTSEIEFLAKIVNDWKFLSILAEISVLDIWRGS